MTLSLACVILSAVGTALVLSRFLTEHMLQRDDEVSAEFIESIVRAERTWDWFANPDRADARSPLDSFFNHVAQMPGVVRANVYQRDGRVLWSSDPAVIGRRFSDNPELDQAFAGRMLVEHGAVDPTKPEYVALDTATGGSRFMEAYLPVWDADRQSVLALAPVSRAMLRETLSEMERDLIERALERTGGNVSRVVRDLGISRDTLRDRLARRDGDQG